YVIKPMTIEPSAGCGEPSPRPHTTYTSGPSAPAGTPEIPIPMRSPKKDGGLMTSKAAATPTPNTATRLMRRESRSAFSSETLTIPFLTNTFLKISLAKTVDMTTNKPSVVDSAAAKITTATNAARNAGNPQATYSNKARSAASSPGTATRAYRPPNNTSKLIAAATI